MRPLSVRRLRRRGGWESGLIQEQESGRIPANNRDGGVSDRRLPRELPLLLTLWAGGSIVSVGWEEGIHEDFSNGPSLKAPSDYKIPTV